MEPKDGEDSSAKNIIPPDELSLRSSSGFSSATSKETLQEASTAPAEDGSSGPPGETNNEGGEAPETMGKQPWVVSHCISVSQHTATVYLKTANY